MASFTNGVLDAVLKWSKNRNRPDWQRDALRRIVTKGKLDKNDLDELGQLCRVGRCMPGSVQASPLAKRHLPASNGKRASVSLVSISDVKGVNNLAPDQELKIEPQGLSIIYGDNGTGKSGYARILKNVCGARHTGRIEPNAFSSEQSPPNASASITYATDQQEQPPETWTSGDPPHPTVSAVRVFDSDCATVHIERKNDLAFLPFGLNIPDELARACQHVQDTINAEIQQLQSTRDALFRHPPWGQATQVGKALSALHHNTNIRDIKRLGTLSSDDVERILTLRQALSQDPSTAAKEQDLRANSIRDIADAVRRMEAKTIDSAFNEVLKAARTARTMKEAAKIAAKRAFPGEPLPGVGGEAWRALWNAARAYSKGAAYRGRPFPAVAEGDRCVLCQQALDAQSQERMTRFDEFIEQETDRKARRSCRTARELAEQLSAESVGPESWNSSLEQLALLDPALAEATQTSMQVARVRRDAVVKALASNRDPRLPSVQESPLGRLKQLESKIRKRADELRDAVNDKQRKSMQAELAELSDRERLGGMIQTIEVEIGRLKYIHVLQECLGDTRTNAITMLGNTIADNLITRKMSRRFADEIRELAGGKVRVEIVRSGGKYGSPRYQVRLPGNSAAPVKDILSEGERTCVALAAFLTDAATADHKSGFVFDDPVSSLDHRWRKKVAERIVKEAENRQIVVFTHDLVSSMTCTICHRRANRQSACCGSGEAPQEPDWSGRGSRGRRRA